MCLFMFLSTCITNVYWSNSLCLCYDMTLKKQLVPNLCICSILSTDVDECASAGLCSQGCVNVLGSYMCTCEQGYTLAADGRNCVG